MSRTRRVRITSCSLPSATVEDFALTAHDPNSRQPDTPKLPVATVPRKYQNPHQIP